MGNIEKIKNKIKILRQVFFFISGLPFAICTLATLCLFAIGGAAIEGLSQSHLRADRIFHSPIFLFLYLCLFLNIFFSLIKRLPFRLNNLSLVFSHFGILLILIELITNHLTKVEGWTYLSLGETSNNYSIPHTYALYVEESNYQHIYPIQNKKLLSMNSSRDLHLINWIPNGTEECSAWFHKEHLLIQGLPPFPLQSNESAPFEWQAVKLLDGRTWDILALKDQSKIEELSLRDHPALIFVKSKAAPDAVYLYDENGLRSRLPLDLSSLVSFDQGNSGYGAMLKIPLKDQEQDLLLYSPLSFSYKPIPLDPILEENHPIIEVSFDHESHILIYDEMGTGFKKPAATGIMLLSFGPLKKKLPFSLRLSELRESLHECTLTAFFPDRTLQTSTLSLNHIWNMKGGYRLCLMNLKDEGALISICKYPLRRFFLYFGILFITIGLLFLITINRRPVL